MNEYEKLRLMYHQEHLLKENNITYKESGQQWRVARQVVETAMGALKNEAKLLTALKLAVQALTRTQAIDYNPPLKKINLDRMNGEPVWVVSYNHDGRWGIVDTSDQSVVFSSNDDFEKDYWFDDKYMFRYKKEIIDHTQELIQHGISDDGYQEIRGI